MEVQTVGVLRHAGDQALDASRLLLLVVGRLSGRHLKAVALERDHLDQRVAESQRAAEVVKSLLTYARRPEPVKAYVDVSVALSRALALMDRD